MTALAATSIWVVQSYAHSAQVKDHDTFTNKCTFKHWLQCSPRANRPYHSSTFTAACQFLLPCFGPMHCTVHEKVRTRDCWKTGNKHTGQNYLSALQLWCWVGCCLHLCLRRLLWVLDKVCLQRPPKRIKQDWARVISTHPVSALHRWIAISWGTGRSSIDLHAAKWVIALVPAMGKMRHELHICNLGTHWQLQTYGEDFRLHQLTLKPTTWLLQLSALKRCRFLTWHYVFRHSVKSRASMAKPSISSARCGILVQIFPD